MLTATQQLLSRRAVHAGADCKLRASSLRKGLAAVSSTQLPDFPYSLACRPDSMTALCGCGDGSVLAVDAGSGEVMHNQKCNAAAVRMLHLGGSSVLAAGDDGSMTILKW